jgi:hypothetical protein
MLKLKTASMDELRKIPDVENVVKAFDEFNTKRGDVIVGRIDHLPSEHVRGISCDHRWIPMPVESANEFLTQLHEETSGIVEYCNICASTCVREGVDGRIISYDATFNYDPDKQKRPKRGH